LIAGIRDLIDAYIDRNAENVQYSLSSVVLCSGVR